VSEYGRLCHGDGGHEGGDRCRRGLTLAILAKKEIDGMQAGDVLEVMATDPGSMPDFQGWAKTSKLAVLREQPTEKDETGREVYVHVLERRG
jgi:tRNA 2-thiouridine synthesizing protein A